MKSSFVILSLFYFQLCAATPIINLEQYTAPGPTTIRNVYDGAMIYLASTDKAVVLSKITLSSNGQTIRLDQLRNNFDDDGFLKGWPVYPDLTISTSNSEDVTENLNGYLFISTPDMAKDPNFFVYSVSDQIKTIDRSNFKETTLVLLNLRVEKGENDPIYKPYYHSRVENFVQPNTTQLYFYRGTPNDGYTDPTYKETVVNELFRNPISMYPTGNANSDTYFFDNVEPVQYKSRTWHIRALGGIKFDVSQEWKDQSTYQTTKETTTGFTMNQVYNYNTTINFKYTPNKSGVFGVMTTTELFAPLNITMCNEIDCNVLNFNDKVNIYADYFQWNRNDTVLYVEPSDPSSGFFLCQYFRIEGMQAPTDSTTSLPMIGSSTSPNVETTTKSSMLLQKSYFFVLASIFLLCMN